MAAVAHRMQVANRRFDPAHRSGSRFIDDSCLRRMPRWVGHPGALEQLQFVVGGVRNSLQVGLEMFSESGCFGRNRRQLGRPQPACHPRGAVDRRAEGRRRQ